MIICILGRQPAIGLAELESRFGAGKVTPVGDVAAQVDVDEQNVPFHLLGSVIKLARPLTVADTTEWPKLLDFCRKELPKLVADLPEGKIKLGLSVYGVSVSLKSLQRSGLEIKKAIRATGRSVRIVPNTALELNSAQAIHNQLTGELGQELLFIRDGKLTHIAQTLHVQDIDDYAKRDFGRPMRDSFVGMLPPKLAQTMLNLAQVHPGSRVLDPFCGTGVVLQEAALMGCSVYGPDVSERMGRYTRDNLNWLRETYGATFDEYFETLDATDATWQQPVDSVVCEGYLGQPMATLPDRTHLEKIIKQCNEIASKFLQNLHGQLAPGTRCCVALPAWFNGKTYIHLQIVDYLEKMGYNRVRFKNATSRQLIYHRSDQIVARELLVLTVKVKELN
jgi:tRNA G10  N-methylase Trm11